MSGRIFVGGVFDSRLSLEGNRRTVPQLLLSSAQQFGERVSITDGARILSFTELPAVAAQVGSYLLRNGVESGDRVIVISENRIDTLELLFGCSWIGAQLVPINPATPAEQLSYFVEYIEPSIIFMEQGYDSQGVSTEITVLELVSIDLVNTSSPTQTLWQGEKTTLPPAPVTPESPLTILLTSGTTGISKGVVCPHGQFLTWGESVGSMLDLGPNDISYTCLPLFHTNALNAAFQCLIAGATFHIGPRFSSSNFWQRNIDAKATTGFLLGAMVSMLLNTPESSRDQAHTVTRILAPGTPQDALLAFESRFGSVLVEGHGMTETNAALGTPFGERKLGYMGKAMAGFEAAVVDEFDSPVPDGEPGELVLRSNTPFSFATGYWRLPEVTVAANKNQWFHTGDRVVRHDGWFKFLDRIKDVIRRRGENISAWEVERVLDSHELVTRSAVVPVPSELGEDEVMAFVIVSATSQPDPESLRAWCRGSLPPFALPRYFEFVDELPLTDTGKVRKQLLRDRGVSEITWDANETTSA
jgi:crotonobetaine/carnitine-CoA ligase